MARAALISLTQSLEQLKYPFPYNKQIEIIHKKAIELRESLRYDAWRYNQNVEERIISAASKTEEFINLCTHEVTISKQSKMEDMQSEMQRHEVLLQELIDQFDSIYHEVNVYVVQVMKSMPVGLSRFADSNKSTIMEFDEELNQIKDRLTGSSPQLSTISILGMGGIGKTTLAKKLYKDPLIEEHFNIFGWLISPRYDEKEMIISLLGSIGHDSDKLREESIGNLRVKLHQSLKYRRYIIVMDDVWDTKALDYVKSIIPDEGNGSRIILTTRLLDVADYAKSLNTIHEMRPLSFDGSWNLFLEKVFEEKCCPPELEMLGKEIVQNCGGLPLAIVVIGGLLSKVDKTSEFWKYVADNTRLELTKNHDHFVKILSLSYDILPQHLKECFLYMGSFHEDEEIHVSRLIKLWAAEGFLEPIENKSLEEVANKNLKDLIGRSLIQVSRVSYIGEIKSCRIHDLLRDLCIRKASEEKFLAVIQNDSWLHPKGRECLKTHQRVSIQFHVQKYPKGVNQISLVRSLLQLFHVREYPKVVTNSNHISPVRSLLHFGETYSSSGFLSFIMNFESLWVLDAPLICFDDKLLIHIVELVNLRFLAFSLKGNPEIPEEISKLSNLETLMVLCPSGRTRLPGSIWEMPQLTHILVKNCFLYSTPRYISNVVLENLQTLLNVFHGLFTKKDFKIMPNLKKLVVSQIYDSKKNWTEFDYRSFVHLRQLETLKCYFIDIGVRGRKSRPLLLNFAFPEKLKKLTLSGCRLPWEKLTVVGSLPNIEVLKLEDHAFTGPVWQPNDGEFPQLKSLKIINSNLEEWITEETDFPNLEHLSLNCCSNLSEIPSTIGNIPTLKMLEVYDCKPSAADSAESIKEEQRSSGNNDLHVRVIRTLIYDNSMPIGSYVRKRFMQYS